MSHKRAEIKEYSKRLLLRLHDFSGLTIFTHRAEDIWETREPVAVIRIPKEISRKFGEAPRILERKAYLSIEVVVTGQNFDETLDQISTKIEKEFSKDLTMDCLLSDLILVETSRDEDDSGRRPAGSQTLIFECCYYTDESTPIDANLLDSIKTEFSH